MISENEVPVDAHENFTFLAGEDAQQYVCQKCGAALIAHKDTVVHFCVFCDSPHIKAERLNEFRKPDGVIPFKVGRDESVSAFYKWCKNGRFAPISLVKDSRVEKMTGLYVPFMLFDCDVDMNISAETNTVSYIHSGGRKSSHITKTTSFYKLIRKNKTRWEKIPFDGAIAVDDALMEDIEPFDYSAIEKFEMKHLEGFLADQFDESTGTLEEKLKKRLDQYCRTFFESTVSQYSEISNIADQSVYHKPISRYTLFPVWMLNYKYLGKNYTFAMNGQTGKVAGKPPVSIGKIIFLGIVSLPVIAFIFRYIGQWILGGL